MPSLIYSEATGAAFGASEGRGEASLALMTFLEEKPSTAKAQAQTFPSIHAVTKHQTLHDSDINTAEHQHVRMLTLHFLTATDISATAPTLTVSTLAGAGPCMVISFRNLWQTAEQKLSALVCISPLTCWSLDVYMNMWQCLQFFFH